MNSNSQLLVSLNHLPRLSAASINFELNQTFWIYRWIVPCFLLRLFDSLLNIIDHQSPVIFAPILTSVFVASSLRVMSRFSHSFTHSKSFSIHWNQSSTFHECSINYLIYRIDILATTLCCKFLACSFVAKLNISIKLGIIIHAFNIWHLYIWHLMKQTFQIILLVVTAVGLFQKIILNTIAYMYWTAWFCKNVE